MTGKKYPPHVQNFFDNIDEVDELASIHTKIAGNTRGRKSKVQVLNKSAIVLLTASWEYYVEDLVRESFKFLIENAENYLAFPYSVLVKASKEIRIDKDERKVWELAGDGWKSILENYKRTTLEKEIDYFHTPRPENIDELYSKLLGIDKITSNWSWKKMSNEDAIKFLNKYIDIRGEIAHNVKTTNSVRKKDVDEYANFLNKTAVILHNRVVDHIKTRVNKEPWKKYWVGSVH